MIDPRPILLCLVAAAIFSCDASAQDKKAPLESLIRSARSAYAAGDLAKAEGFADKAVASYYAKAVDDVNRAIKLSPDEVGLYQLRGTLRFKHGEFTGSVQDFDRYLKVYPQREPHHWQRGISYYYTGEFDKGVKQFELHRTVNGDDVENSFWHYLCMAALKDPKTAREKLIPVTGDARVPMAEVQKMLAGEVTPDDVMKVAKDSPREGRARFAMFYAHLYVGLYLDANGDQDGALKHMKLAATEYVISHYMGDVAIIHLRQLQQKTKPAK
jgi:lipoprotein NlpI